MPELRSQVIANLVEKVDRGLVVGGSVMMAKLYSGFAGMVQIHSLDAPAKTRPVGERDQFVISMARAIMLSLAGELRHTELQECSRQRASMSVLVYCDLSVKVARSRNLAPLGQID
ncbi:hypothetical protein HFN89_02575 [Rhizobium laguerreae]|nr:hypothetical protein [Rhizobium laguerreae]